MAPFDSILFFYFINGSICGILAAKIFYDMKSEFFREIYSERSHRVFSIILSILRNVFYITVFVSAIIFVKNNGEITIKIKVGEKTNVKQLKDQKQDGFKIQDTTEKESGKTGNYQSQGGE